jgi:hypothetical protein
MISLEIIFLFFYSVISTSTSSVNTLLFEKSIVNLIVYFQGVVNAWLGFCSVEVFQSQKSQLYHVICPADE